jgi:hypothetical protein
MDIPCSKRPVQSVALVTVGGTADRSANLINQQYYNIQDLVTVGSLCELPASAKSGQVDRQGGYALVRPTAQQYPSYNS